MLNDSMYKSEKKDWETPDYLFERYDEIYNFDIDVCATEENKKCEKFFSPEQDGLQQKWEGVCWMNPPYGKEISKWMEKAYLSSLEGATVVCLIPARTDTKWFHSFALKGQIEFLDKRVTYKGAKQPAPFPNLIVVFKSL